MLSVVARVNFLGVPFVKRRFLLTLAGFAAAALGVTALLYAVAAALRPDVMTAPPAAPAAQLSAVEEARRSSQHLDLQRPPVLVRNVDYSAGSRAPWWPTSEAPVLADLVRDGKLPPVAERTGSEPLVLEG